MERYHDEVQARWGDTAAFAEYAQKNPSAADAAGLTAVFEEFARCMARGETAESEAAQALVKKLQEYITVHFYTCTDEILAGLGQMYVADERFGNEIDRCAAGTAAFVGRAIATYCGK